MVDLVCVSGGGARAALMRMLDALENVGWVTGANLMMLKEREKPAASRCAGGAGGGLGNAGGTMGEVVRLYGATNACEGRGGRGLCFDQTSRGPFRPHIRFAPLCGAL